MVPAQEERLPLRVPISVRRLSGHSTMPPAERILSSRNPSVILVLIILVFYSVLTACAPALVYTIPPHDTQRTMQYCQNVSW